jgi:ASC-1-like (ASCH) protein
MNYEEKYLKYKKKYIHNKNKSSHNKMDSAMHLSEPWFTLISMGLKTVEGRKNKGRFKEMKVGEVVEWKNHDFKERRVKTRITGKEVYKTFAEYLETEGLDKCLPGIPSLEHGLSVYYKYFTKEDEKKYGVVAIRMELVK